MANRLGLPADFFSSDFYTDRLIRYLDEACEEDRPFFAYAAYTAPHWPLQAKDEDIDRYRGVYDDGWDALRERRVAGLVGAGALSSDVAVPPRLPFVPDWASLSAEERRRQPIQGSELALFEPDLVFRAGTELASQGNEARRGWASRTRRRNGGRNRAWTGDSECEEQA